MLFPLMGPRVNFRAPLLSWEGAVSPGVPQAERTSPPPWRAVFSHQPGAWSSFWFDPAESSSGALKRGLQVEHRTGLRRSFPAWLQPGFRSWRDRPRVTLRRLMCAALAVGGLAGSVQAGGLPLGAGSAVFEASCCWSRRMLGVAGRCRSLTACLCEHRLLLQTTRRREWVVRCHKLCKALIKCCNLSSECLMNSFDCRNPLL